MKFRLLHSRFLFYIIWIWKQWELLNVIIGQVICFWGIGQEILNPAPLKSVLYIHSISPRRTNIHTLRKINYFNTSTGLCGKTAWPVKKQPTSALSAVWPSYCILPSFSGFGWLAVVSKEALREKTKQTLGRGISVTKLQRESLSPTLFLPGLQALAGELQKPAWFPHKHARKIKLHKI